MQNYPRRAIQHSIYRAGAVLRATLFLLALLTDLTRFQRAEHPVYLVLVIAVMAIWTIIITVLNQIPERRTLLWMGLDLIITLAVAGTSRFILGVPLLEESYLGVGGYWVVAAPLAIAIWKGVGPGALSGFVVGMTVWAQAPTVHERAWVDFVCVVAVPAFAGYVARELDELVAERDRGYAAAAALAERERLNRIVHDGVLQVLAMVEREGRDLGPRGVRLATLANEQENQLRALLQDRNIDREPGTRVDVVGTLSRLQDDGITVSAMAGEVLLDERRVGELEAAVRQILSNAHTHAGIGAKVWILIESEDGGLTVSVRDDGVGMSQSNVDAAARSGRLGITESIIGRLESIGGTATWTSAPGQGVEWELRLPLEDKE